VVEEEVAVLIVLVRRHRRAVGAAVRRAVDDEVPDAVEEKAGPAVIFVVFFSYSCFQGLCVVTFIAVVRDAPESYSAG